MNIYALCQAVNIGIIFNRDKWGVKKFDWITIAVLYIERVNKTALSYASALKIQIRLCVISYYGYFIKITPSLVVFTLTTPSTKVQHSIRAVLTREGGPLETMLVSVVPMLAFFYVFVLKTSVFFKTIKEGGGEYVPN